MTNPDYPAFRRMNDEVDHFSMHPLLVERAGLPNAYVVHQERLERLMAKAQAYDHMTRDENAPEDPEVDALKGILEGYPG